MKNHKRFLALLLVLCMLLSVAPISTLAIESGSTESVATESTESTADGFLKIYNLDCGRLYFSVEQIKAIIDLLAKNDYTHLGLAFGNSGFRFLLDDMTVGSYASDAVKNAIMEGNTYYAANDGHNNSSAANTCLTESQMDTIIAYASSKGISIIPALNSPGHMNTIVYAMGKLGISNAGYSVSSSYNSESTININNETVTAFTNALIQKYITYFAGKGCTMFNLGADEFANDPTDDTKLGFDNSMKEAFISYVNNVASMITAANMTPLMFNDGYAWSDASFNKDIVICYWTAGSVSSTAIANAGHKIINTSQKWYYVLGEPFGSTASDWCSYARASNGVNNVPVTTLIDGGSVGGSLIGAQMCLWCDYTDEAYTDEEATKVETLISTFAANNTDYFTPDEVRSITVGVNQSATDTISGQRYTDYKIADTSKVSVSLTQVEGAEETVVSTTAATELKDGATYIIRVYDTTYALTNTKSTGYFSNGLAFVSNTLTATSGHLWALEVSGSGYKLKDADGNYLSIDNSSASVGSTGDTFTFTSNGSGWTIRDTDGYYFNALGGLENYHSMGGWTSDALTMELYKVTTATAASTEVTFTGREVGTTSVTVGHVTYNVNVTEEDLSNITLTYHPWISTYAVGAEGSHYYNNPGTANPQTLAANAQGVNSEEGAAFADLVWETGDWQWEAEAQTYYWKATVLPEGSHQEKENAIDHSMSGTDFTYIRYWGGVWSYSSDRETWTEVQDTDEVCAYYLQKTEVTTEVDTYVKDWAFTTDNAHGQGEDRYQKALSFAVVYPGGTMNPSEDDIYAKSTLIYWDNLANLGFIRIGVRDYEVSKITYTMGARTETAPESRNWTTSDSITWNKVTIDGTTWYDETVCWDESYGTEPVINGQDLGGAIYAGSATSGTTNYNGTWGANDAVLILIYLKPIVTEDSLTVVYVDEKFNDTLYTYHISVNSTAQEATTFLNGIGKVTTTTDGTTSIDTGATLPAFKDADGNVSDTRKDVTGYGIINNLGVVQSFQTDLTKVPDAIGKYDSSLYKYTGSKISEDGKTLYLYYNIDTTVLSPNFVVDFGLPITFPLTDLLGTGTEASEVTAVSGLSARYGTLTYNSETRSFTYTPTKILQNVDVLTIQLTINGVTNITNVGVTPATTVHYEESFITWSGWTGGTTMPTVMQNTAVLGKDTYNYGYDLVYAATTGASNGTYATSSTVGHTGTFTFTGTGFDLYANCTTETGWVSVQVKDSDGKTVKLYNVNTVVAEEITANGDSTDGQNTGMYNLPIVSEQGLDYGTYTVTIRKIMKDSGAVNIDGVRINNTIQNTSVFKADLEDDPEYYQLRDYVLSAMSVTDSTSADYGTLAEMAEQVYADISDDTEAPTAAILANGKYNTDVQNLLDNGPKNEVYLHAGEALVFSVKTSRAMQIGLKAPVAATSYTITVATEKTLTGTLNTTVDMFYELGNTTGTETTYTITITNTGSDILSITDLKICDDPDAAFVPLTAEDIETALRAMGYTDSETGDDETTEPETPETPVDPETPEEPVEPETPVVPEVTYADAVLTVTLVDYTGNRIGSAELTVNGVEGETCVFTAEEILAAAAEQIPEGYALVDESAVSDVEVVYGESQTASIQIGKVATLNVTFVNWRGKKVGTATFTAVQTGAGKHTVSAATIRGAAPAASYALWLIPVSVAYGNTATIIVPVI